MKLNRKKELTMETVSNKIQSNPPCRRGVILATALVLISFLSSEAQLTLRQLPRPAHTKKSAAARTQADPIQLPFFDDFSSTPVIDGVATTGGIPLESHWEFSSQSAYVNPGNGINPPSINVATLDGLNRFGLKYSEQQLNNGFADTLVSQPIDLSILSIPLSDRESVYLSFFYQRGGYAETPDRKDFLQLEFKNADGVWEVLSNYGPDQAPDPAIFYLATIKVEGDKFFHGQFQFRLRNFGRLSGPFDAWHVDHVYLDKFRGVDSEVKDITFTKGLSPLFGSYYSMPLEHFRDSSLLEPIESGVFTLRTNKPGVGYDGIIRIDNILEDESVVTHTSQPATARAIRPGDEVSSKLNYLEHVTFTLDSLPHPTKVEEFDPAAKRMEISYELILALGDEPDILHFKNNDTIRTTYHLDDYYAYDDGSAEYAAVLTNPGVRVAYAFDLIRTGNEPEFINGFDVCFPKWGIVPNLSPAFYIYDDNNGEPGEVLWGISSLPISTLEQNQFQFVPIFESVKVNKRFYIGWEAPVGGLIAVGVDFNNNTSDKIFYRANGVWNINEDVFGSLMIRPHMGEGVVSGIPEETKALRAYPNPNQGTFYIQDKVTVVDVISVSGQRIPVTYTWEDDQTRISLNEPAPGMYILRTLKGTDIQTQKIAVTGTF
jgi:hypothetical protein